MPLDPDAPKPPSSRQWPPKGTATVNALPNNGPPPPKWNPITNSIHVNPEATNEVLPPRGSQKVDGVGQPQENVAKTFGIKGQSKGLGKALFISSTTTTALSNPSGQRMAVSNQTNMVAEGVASKSSLHTRSSSKHSNAEYLRSSSSKTRIGSFTWEDTTRCAATRIQTATPQKQKEDASSSKTNHTAHTRR